MSKVIETDHRLTDPLLKKHLQHIIQKPMWDVCPYHGYRDCMHENFVYPRNGKVVIYINPPFSTLKRFALKAFDLADSGIPIILVVPVNQRNFFNRIYISTDRILSAHWIVLKNFKWGNFKDKYSCGLMLFNIKNFESGKISVIDRKNLTQNQ